MNIKFSLLIATLNRPEILKTCVNGLLNQTYDNYEIIIIDQSDKEFRNDSIAEADNRITYIHIDEKGLSHARNVGLKYVTGNYVCLVDDDGLYDSNVLKQADKFIQKNHSTVLGGTIEDPVTGNIRGVNHNYKIKWKDAFKYHQSPSMIIESEFLKKHRFDEYFGVGAKYGSGEESDIVLAALSSGKEVYFTNGYKVIHTVEGSDLSKIPEDKIKKYALGYGALCKKAVIKYSKFWGMYYIIRTVIGNFIMWMVQGVKGNHAVAKARKIRAVYTAKGFMDYRAN